MQGISWLAELGSHETGQGEPSDELAAGDILDMRKMTPGPPRDRYVKQGGLMCARKCGRMPDTLVSICWFARGALKEDPTERPKSHRDSGLILYRHE